jgi:hypothetical protein
VTQLALPVEVLPHEVMREKTLGGAIDEGTKGMTRAARATDAKTPGWTDLALQFLKVYAHKHSLVNPEDVYDAAVSWGVFEPKDQRAWGSVYKRACKLKVIARSVIPYQRRKGHGSVALLWKSLVYQG